MSAVFWKVKVKLLFFFNIIEDLRSHLYKNCVTFLVLLDHSTAFGTGDHSVLISKLHKQYQNSNSSCNLIYFDLSNRSQLVYLNGLYTWSSSLLFRSVVRYKSMRMMCSFNNWNHWHINWAFNFIIWSVPRLLVY